MSCVVRQSATRPLAVMLGERRGSRRGEERRAQQSAGSSGSRDREPKRGGVERSAEARPNQALQRTLAPQAFGTVKARRARAAELGRSAREGLGVPEAWRRLPVPYICERMLGFSVPQDDTVLVVSYEGTHLVRLPPTDAVETDPEYTEYDLYDPRTGVCRYRGRAWDIIGLSPGRPLLDGRGGERLVLDAVGLTVSVVVGGVAVWSSEFENFSGDWAAATFSPDGRFIVLACPYDFDFRVWERVQDAEPGAAADGGGM